MGVIGVRGPRDGGLEELLILAAHDAGKLIQGRWYA